MALHKILKIVAIILSLAGIVFLGMILSKGDDVVKATGEGVDGYLYIAYITLAIVLLFVIIFVLKGIFAGNIKRTLLSILGFLVVVAIGYALASGVETPMQDGKMLSESGSRWVGTGLYVFYILAILAIGSMVFSGIKKMTTR
ncbi:hypothetical protein [Marixanthomonas spongiae]|uniref:Uncharacterized protein n=1 Tax=Marixanthomonas spongiae TaxID=2174845 RepID=A0A2U0HZI7_9FLAO|nr:hypothetical protein [Marixanthomonas spongiae]PVW14285.1 hypothetical protein DDV96_10800 [Marixanthomonas spongiae]